MHWHWGNSIQNDPPYYLVPHSGEQQFKGPYPIGNLIDIGANKQILKIAIVLNRKEYLAAATAGKAYQYNYEKFAKDNLDFGSIFYKLSKNPQLIPQAGGEQILFYSCEVKLSDSRSYHNRIIELFDATFFVHGLFFAHNDEPEIFESGYLTRGNFLSVYKHPNPPKATEWTRQPKK